MGWIPDVWAEKTAGMHCICHGWPMLQCPNTSEAEAYAIAASESRDSGVSMEDHMRSQEMAEFMEHGNKPKKRRSE